MLLSLHVKNLALIEEEEVTFTDGLNILSGETGAGKSIIIGSVNLALGSKADKALIRTGEEYALIEMVFQLDNDSQREKLREMDIEPEEDDTILIKRKIYPGRSQCTIQGETVTLKQLREMSESLIDVYGQRENQKLLQRDAQLSVIDEFAGKAASDLLARIRGSWDAYSALRRQWEGDDLDQNARAREIDLLSYEAKEIEDAGITPGEDEKLEERYRVLSNFRRISEAAAGAGEVSSDDDGSAASQVGRALRSLSQVAGLDPALDSVAALLSDVDGMLSDFSRALSDYMDSLNFDPEEFQQIESRLNLINRLKDKYGRSIEDILAALEQKKKRLEDLEDYENSRAKLHKEMMEEQKRLFDLCAALSKVRLEASGEFIKKMTAELLDLNFNQVDFRVDLDSKEEYVGPGGYDHVTFYISMNPGESPRPLDRIASGGELSRIMLALKTVFAGRDDIHTFIFDEIDSGISGQTAWKVAQKMGRLALDHQILCITHLPQIAAMEDSHYLIEKSVTGSRTQTHIRRLSEEDSTKEIGRMLGGERITKATLDNALEMKQMALKTKAER